MNIGLADILNEELVQRFAEICLGQDKADLEDDIQKFNELFQRQEEVETELKSRGTAARSCLMTLYDHPNMQVKLQAAKATLAVAPIEARRMIEWIANSKWMPQAGDAGMCLWALDEGIFKPT